MPQKLFKINSFILLAFLVGGLFFASPARAEAGYCLCYSDEHVGVCERMDSKDNCDIEKKKISENITYTECPFFTGDNAVSVCNVIHSTALTVLENKQKQALQEETQAKGLMNRLLPDDLKECFIGARLPVQCRNVEIFIKLGLNFATFLFGIVGALALAMFVYGGFMMILSQGNPEKVKKGTGAIMAALIGLVIVFSAYMLVQWLEDVIKGVS